MSVAVSLPEKVVHNDEIGALIGVADDWIVRRTGIQLAAHRRERTSDWRLTPRHARGRRWRAPGVDPVEVDLVIVATTTSDELMPGAAPLVAYALGAIHAGAFDVGSACTGFLSALAIAAGQIESGRAAARSSIGADLMSRITDPSDRSTAAVFADGAGRGGADRDRRARAGSARWCSAPTAPAPSTSTCRARTGEDPDARPRDVPRGGRAAVAGYHQATPPPGSSLDEIDLFVYHQANGRILSAVG